MPQIIVKLTSFILALIISFLLFIAIPMVRNLVGFKKPELRQTYARRRIIMEAVRPSERKEPIPVKPLRQIQSDAPEPTGSSGDNGLSFKLSPDLGVEGAGGVEIGMQNQDLDAMVFEENQTDENVVPVFTPSIEYPQRARELGVQGTLEAIITIDRDGSVIKIEILKSPHRSISDEAKKVIASWRFKPARIKGVPVKVRRIQAIEFKLDE